MVFSPWYSIGSTWGRAESVRSSRSGKSRIKSLSLFLFFMLQSTEYGVQVLKIWYSIVWIVCCFGLYTSFFGHCHVTLEARIVNLGSESQQCHECSWKCVTPSKAKHLVQPEHVIVRVYSYVCVLRVYPRMIGQELSWDIVWMIDCRSVIDLSTTLYWHTDIGMMVSIEDGIIQTSPLFLYAHSCP